MEFLFCHFNIKTINEGRLYYKTEPGSLKMNRAELRGAFNANRDYSSSGQVKNYTAKLICVSESASVGL